MFTVEIKINGSMIGHVYGRNVGDTPKGSQYDYEYYDVENRKIVGGKILHKRERGIKALIASILADTETKKE